MAKDQRKRQQIQQKNAAKRQARAIETKRKYIPSLFRSNARTLVLEASAWPIHETLVSTSWRDTMGITQIVVARRNPGTGEVVTGAFLVDLGCLGVKSAFTSRFVGVREYETNFRDGIMERQSLMSADINLAARILREAVAYAKNLGFEPDRDYNTARLILGDADPDAVSEPIPTGGEDGKPFFMNGPHDNAERIINHLMRKLGPDGFTYIASISPGATFLRGVDEYDDDDIV